MLSLSVITSREATRDSAREEAKANARMALMLALGELQKSVGPDQRITASASILDPDKSPQTEEYSTFPNPYWTGVWRSDDVMEPSDYEARKTDLFENWLVSLRDPAEALNFDKASTKLVDDNVVTMLGKGTTGEESDDSRDVEAEIISLAGRDGIAWWVADESVKARLNLPAFPEANAKTPVLQAQLQSAPVSGSRMAESLEWLNSATTVDAEREDVQRLVTLRTLSSHPENADGKPASFHDFTTTAMSVPVDVRDGGMKWDLSRLFGNDELPTAYKSSARMQIGNISLPTEKPLYEAGNPQGAFPSWQRLADYHRLSQFVEWEDKLPFIAYQNGGGNSNWNKLRSMHCQPPLPVLVRMQLFFSLAESNGRIGLVIEPVCTFWNPYNVEIRIPYNSGVMRLYSWWPSVQITVNRGSKGSRTPDLTGYGTAVFQYSAAAGPNAHMGFDIGGMTMKPGETVVYSDTNNAPRLWNNRFAQYGVSIEGRPGWSETGGLLGYNAYGTSYGDPVSGAETMTVTAVFNANPTQYGGHFSQGKHLLFHRLIMHEAGPGVDKFADPDTYRGIQAFGIHDVNTSEYRKTLHTNGIITRNGIRGAALLGGKKEPLFVIDMAARTEQKGDTRAVPTTDPEVLPYLHTSWSHGSIIGNDTLDESEKQTSYWQASVYKVADWDDQAVEIEPNSDRGFFGSGNTAETGVNFVTMKEIPTREPLSLAAYRNFDILYNPYINKLGYGKRSDASDYSADPATSFIIGGGHAHPLVGRSEVVRSNAIKSKVDGRRYDYFDHAYLANWTLFDRYFHSGLPPLWTDVYQEKSASERNTELREIVEGDSREHVANPRFVWKKGGAEKAVELIVDPETGHERVAERLTFAGFNVNSTSVEAWRTFLGAMQAVEVPRTSGDALAPGMAENYPDETAAFPRQQLANDLLDDAVLMTAVGAKKKSLLWNGFRALNDEEIETLAESIVEQVKIRGPFFSMADFVNRRISTSASDSQATTGASKAFNLAATSALQSAIDASELNEKEFSIKEDKGNGAFANDDAASGLRAAGAPSFLMQGDLLQALGPAMTVRGDTFTIRAYGESKDARGNVLARVWCEAVVQRGHEYVSSDNEVHQSGEDLTEMNKLFGRKLSIVSFRWLGTNEV
ncbi:hypothetical protein [Oceaniferula spumae]